MRNYIILTDSTSDIGPEVRAQYGITDYVHGHVHFSDGRDFKTTLEWDSITREDFYSALSNRQMKITTAPASPEEYYEIFNSYAERGYDILSLSISTSISTTYNSATVAAERVMAEHPECRILCVDTLRMSGALGLLTVYAYALQSEGKTIDEVYAWVEENKYKVHQMGPIDDLMFVARRGRISTGKAIFGSFAGVKPMGDCNSTGYVTVLTKVKGIKKALDVTVAYVKEASVDVENQIVLVVHSNREEYANQLCDKIRERLHPKTLLMSDVFCASGTNIGPGMVGVYFLGENVSENCETEKEIMNRAIANCK